MLKLYGVGLCKPGSGEDFNSLNDLLVQWMIGMNTVHVLPYVRKDERFKLNCRCIPS